MNSTLEMAKKIGLAGIVPYGAHQFKSLHVVGGKIDDMASGYISQCHLTQGQHLQDGGGGTELLN